MDVHLLEETKLFRLRTGDAVDSRGRSAGCRHRGGSERQEWQSGCGQ
jgi:hypothetical protein